MRKLFALAVCALAVGACSAGDTASVEEAPADAAPEHAGHARDAEDAADDMADHSPAQHELLTHLDRTRELFLASIEGVSEEQWNYKPAEDRWSIAEVASHVTVSEEFILASLQAFMETAATPEQLAAAAGKNERISELILDRSQKFQAPEPVLPAMEIGAPDELTADFGAKRLATSDFVAANADLADYVGPHPAFEELDLVGWVYFLSGHTERHTLQIEEVKADPGYPADPVS